MSKNLKEKIKQIIEYELDKDFFGILGLKESASDSDIKKAHAKIKESVLGEFKKEYTKEYQKNQNKNGAEELFNENEELFNKANIAISKPLNLQSKKSDFLQEVKKVKGAMLKCISSSENLLKNEETITGKEEYYKIVKISKDIEALSDRYYSLDNAGEEKLGEKFYNSEKIQKLMKPFREAYEKLDAFSEKINKKKRKIFSKRLRKINSDMTDDLKSFKKERGDIEKNKSNKKGTSQIKTLKGVFKEALKKYEGYDDELSEGMMQVLDYEKEGGELYDNCLYNIDLGIMLREFGDSLDNLESLASEKLVGEKKEKIKAKGVREKNKGGLSKTDEQIVSLGKLLRELKGRAEEDAGKKKEVVDKVLSEINAFIKSVMDLYEKSKDSKKRHHLESFKKVANDLRDFVKAGVSKTKINQLKSDLLGLQKKKVNAEVLSKIDEFVKSVHELYKKNEKNEDLFLLGFHARTLQKSVQEKWAKLEPIERKKRVVGFLKRLLSKDGDDVQITGDVIGIKAKNRKDKEKIGSFFKTELRDSVVKPIFNNKGKRYQIKVSQKKAFGSLEKKLGSLVAAREKQLEYLNKMRGLVYGMIDEYFKNPEKDVLLKINELIQEVLGKKDEYKMVKGAAERFVKLQKMVKELSSKNVRNVYEEFKRPILKRAKPYLEKMEIINKEIKKDLGGFEKRLGVLRGKIMDKKFFGVQSQFDKLKIDIEKSIKKHDESLSKLERPKIAGNVYKLIEKERKDLGLDHSIKRLKSLQKQWSIEKFKKSANRILGEKKVRPPIPKRRKVSKKQSPTVPCKKRRPSISSR